MMLSKKTLANENPSNKIWQVIWTSEHESESHEKHKLVYINAELTSVVDFICSSVIKILFGIFNLTTTIEMFITSPQFCKF